MTAKTEAHRRIAELVTKHGPTWLEKRLELGEGTVRSWVLRGRVPQERIRARVAERLGIPVNLWESPAANNPRNISRVKTTSPKERRTIPPASGDVTREMAPTTPVAKGEVVAGAAPSDPSDPRENAIATLRILRRALEGAEADQIPSLANAVTSSSRLLARLSGSLDVTEAQVLRSAAWGKLVKVVRDVLAAYPGAPAALDKAMAEYEARA